MVGSKREAAVMFFVGVVLAIVATAIGEGTRIIAILGVAVALFGGVQWLMYANRDINRQKDEATDESKDA